MKPTVFGRVSFAKAASLATLLLLPANLQLNVFSTAEASDLALREEAIDIDHEARVNHAQELLGKHAAEQAGVTSSEIVESLETYIFNHVSAALRQEDKPRARAITRAILRESARQEMDPVFVMSIISQESRFDPRARGHHGEIGLMQIKPSTAAWIAKRYGVEWTGAESLFDPATNIRLATQYFGWLRGSFRRKPTAYVAAYNMGPVAVRRKLAENITPSVYAGDVMGKYRGHYRKIAKALASSPKLEFTVSMADSKRGQAFGRISN